MNIVKRVSRLVPIRYSATLTAVFVGAAAVVAVLPDTPVSEPSVFTGRVEAAQMQTYLDRHVYRERWIITVVKGKERREVEFPYPVPCYRGDHAVLTATNEIKCEAA